MSATWDQIPQWEIWCDGDKPECKAFNEVVYDPETAAEKIDAHNAEHHPDAPPAVVV